MTIDVRTANPGDADAICDVHVASWRAGYAHIFPPSILDAADFESTRRTMWSGWTHSPTPDRRLIVATLDTRVLGFAHTGLTENDDATNPSSELLGFYTHPDSWGTGVAARMMASALDHLVDLATDRSILWTLHDAHRARAFYEKSGWRLSGRTDIWTRYPDFPVADVEYEYDLTARR
jgi:GNAT superfamily N-acetyltransferase